jgi:hypothetical protein
MVDITDLAHERDGDGDLLPVEKTIEVRGEGEADLKVIPATSGQRREWRQRLEDESDELGDETEAELFDEFLPYDPDDFGDAESWNDIRPALSDALGNAIFAELFDTEEDDFEKALTEAMEDVTEGNSGTMD